MRVRGWQGEMSKTTRPLTKLFSRGRWKLHRHQQQTFGLPQCKGRMDGWRIFLTCSDMKDRHRNGARMKETVWSEVVTMSVVTVVTMTTIRRKKTHLLLIIGCWQQMLGGAATSLVYCKHDGETIVFSSLQEKLGPLWAGCGLGWYLSNISSSKGNIWSSKGNMWLVASKVELSYE